MDNFHRANPDWYPLLKENAKLMRLFPTEAEAYLWLFIKNKALGVTFRRQVVILDYIADFYSSELELIIEIDGGYHFQGEQIILDKARTERLTNKGYRIIRFTNEEVLDNIEEVIKNIRKEI